MRLTRFLLAAALLLGAALCARAEDPTARELRWLQGRWIVAKFLYTPSRTTDPVAGTLEALGGSLDIMDGKLSPNPPVKNAQALPIQFDPTAKPKSVDLTLPDGRVLPGIYLLEADVLTLAVSTGDARPTTLRSAPGQVVVILTRFRPRLFR
jgi:uncharacterized protein (TIGR03067 family)